MLLHAHTSRPSNQSPRRRAFALPLVILIVLVGGLAIALLLQRHSVQALAYQRQIASYTDHHESSGIMECILNWLQTARGKIDTNLGEGGLAFTMDLGTDPETGNALGRVEVSLQDGQGAALRDASTVSGRRREIVQDLTYILDNLPEELKVEGMLRQVGPPEISLRSAPPIVIEALCLAILQDQKKAAEAAKLILRKRAELTDDANASQIMAALSGLELTQQQQKELSAMLVATPSLFQCIAETKDTLGRLKARSGGLYQQAAISTNETFKQRGAFLTWEQLPLDSNK